MKAIVMTDLEGVAGVVSFEDQAFATGKYYEQAKKLLTAEVNAAIDAMVEEGIEDILIVDGHGAGGIVYEELKSPAKLLHGRPFPWGTLKNEIYKRFDVGVMIGQHAMAGVSNGNLNHTQSSRTVEYYKLNGKFIGEIAQWALYCGALDVPMIFLSGDQAACKEAENLIDGIITAPVKEGLNRGSAISLSQKDAHNLIKSSLKQAIRKHKQTPVPPLKWQGPYILEKRFLFTETADSFASNPLYKRIDAKTVQLESDNILDIIYA